MAEHKNGAQNPSKEETILTMVDVLKEEEELENDANAVLGGSDERNCSYSKGYVKRQALYACLSCTSRASPAGVCLACSIVCHKNHELVELYTKRNFRCDCGNKKFPSNPCALTPEKEIFNEKNSYNHNFTGTYCTCKRPYPDPEDEEPDAMVQCIMCEDWYHGRHLGGPLPESEEYDEMICKQCMAEHPFLWIYNQGDNCKKDVEPLIDVVNILGSEENIEPQTLELKKKEPKCILQMLKSKYPRETGDGPAFWIEGWRKQLCACSHCLDLYDQHKCQYLLDPEDTVQAYEERGKAGHVESQYDAGLLALGQLNRVEQIEAIHGYNDMMSELKDYLKKFADNKKVVREEDIKEFFTQMTARKRQRVLMPHFCH